MGSELVRIMLLGFAEAHLQYILFLEHRFYCYLVEVLLVSVKSDGSMIECEAKWLQ